MTRWALAAAAYCALAITVGEASAAGGGAIRLLYQADLDGRFASPACGRSESEGPDYAATVGAIVRERERDAQAGGDAPIVLLGGNQALPDLFGRSLLERGRDGVEALAKLISRGGYDAIALGHHELALPPSELSALVVALGARGLPIVASNLRCAPARRALCAATRPHAVVRRAGQAVAVLATIAPSVLPGVPERFRDGIFLDDPVKAVAAAIQRLRSEGVTVVVVMAQGPRGEHALDAMDSFARALPPAGAPDVILAGGIADGARPLRLLRREGVAPIVGSAPGSPELVEVTLAATAAAEIAVTAIPATADVVDPATVALLRAETPHYCAHYGVPAAAGPIRGTLTRDTFTTYLLEVMRRRADAEIAVVNRPFVKRAAFPLSGTLTRSDVYRALPYTSIIGVARVPGTVVEKLLGAAVGDARVAVAGLARSGANLKVNGRPLDKTRSYRVATIEFVAEGGDGVVDPAAFPWKALPGRPDLRAAMEEFLRSDTAVADGDATVDPATDFGPPAADRALVVAVTDVGLDLLDTSIDNGPAYGDAQLARTRQTSLKGELAGLVTLRLPVHEADGRLNLKYGWARNQPPAGVAASGETVDLVTFSVTYNYRGLRASSPRAYIPDPYVRMRIESELTRPDVGPTQPRTFHHFELTDTAGALFTIATKLKLRAGGGAVSELLAPGDTGGWRPVFEAGATLDPVALATIKSMAVRFEGLADYTFVDPGGLDQHQLRGTVKLSVPLVPLVYFTTGLDVFAVRRENLGWATSFDTTVGLRLHFDAAHQRL